MNKLIIIGNLTRDPESRTTKGGKTVCSFTVAVNDRRGGQDNTSYFRVSAWDKTGESCQRYLSKGKKVFVAGPVSVSSYQDGNCETRTQMEVTAHDIEFLSPRADVAAQVPAFSAPDVPVGMTPAETEELPF